MVTPRLARCLAVLLLALAFAPRLAAEVEVTIDRNPVQVNESFQLVFSLDRNPDREPDFSPLQQHFIILNQGSNTTLSIINGEYRRSIRYTLQLMPKQIGDFMVPAIRFDDERSKPFEITVKPSSIGSVPQDQLVLEVMVDRDEVYVQSQVILKLRLLSAVDLTDYQFGDVAIDQVDAVVEPLGKAQQYQTRIADSHYLVLEKRFAIFPQQSGRLEVSPLVAEVRLRSRSNFDPFRGGGEIRRLRSQPVYVEVKPIPADFDAPHWLPANSVELREDWQGDPDALVAGEPITRGISVIADGLTAAQLPELTLPPIDGVKQYPDQPALENTRSGDGIRGRRSQKVALIPGAEGVYRLPRVELRWWNRETGRLEVAMLPERELVVRAPEAAPPSVTAEKPPAAAAPVPAAVAGGVNAFWLWLSLFLACGWALSAACWWLSRRRAGEAPPAASVEHPTLRQARRQLRQACDSNDAAAAREALLDWGRALLDPRPVANLHRLCDELGAEFAQQVDALNTSLYARSAPPWRGEALLRICRQFEARHAARAPAAPAGLAPLNPAS